ncbi:hypothetical protein C8F04DRAFT_1070323 [Mycena alexandri]|uniref:Uncharacterized protein n=1 Tax=Mycena alexandri TaxID=1745969 RepID=A0AAD6XC17_9AGAR|nr:hypothetical protein C8F04DRAFT_1070323 [Mycena alexandri]
MPMTPGTKESFIGVFIENIIYGAYLSVFIECCAILRRQRTRNVKHMYLTATTALMVILITMRCILDTIQCVVALKSSSVDFGFPNSLLNSITNSCWFFLTTVADAFIVFRTFVVWNRNWLVIILPTVICVANLGTWIWLSLVLHRFTPDEDSVFQRNVTASTNAFIALTLSTNLLCTGLISCRIFHVHHKVAGLASGSGHLNSMKIISVIVESATMYTLLLIATLICESHGSYVNFVLFDCTPPTIGLVFSYIIIRVSRNTSYGETMVDTTTMKFGPGVRSHTTQTFELGQSHNLSSTKGELEVRLEQATHQYSDLVSGPKDADTNVVKYGSVV